MMKISLVIDTFNNKAKMVLDKENMEKFSKFNTKESLRILELAEEEIQSQIKLLESND